MQIPLIRFCLLPAAGTFRNTISIFKTIPHRMSHASIHPIAQSGFDTSQLYARARPSYSNEVVNFLLDKLGIPPPPDASTDQPVRILELGAGTGKFTRTLQEVLRDSKVQIIASEPLLSMREEFRKTLPDIEIKDFQAENIGRENTGKRCFCTFSVGIWGAGCVKLNQYPCTTILSWGGGLKSERVIIVGHLPLPPPPPPHYSGGSGGMLTWENLGFSYSQIPEDGFKINKQCIDTNVQHLKCNVFTVQVY